jgi:hypothetical protein
VQLPYFWELHQILHIVVDLVGLLLAAHPQQSLEPNFGVPEEKLIGLWGYAGFGLRI